MTFFFKNNLSKHLGFLGSILFFSSGLCAQNDTLSLLFVGDVMGHTPQITSAYDPVSKTYNYHPVFEYVKPIISKADLAFANLEVTLPGEGPYKGYPQFRTPDALAPALKEAGFDVIVTANNHSNDAGKKGVLQTIETIKSQGFYQTGTFNNQAEKDSYYPLLMYKNGFSLAILNYTYGTNGLPDVYPTVVNRIDEDLIQKDMQKAMSYNADAIIVLIHWGEEYQLNESKTQNALASKIFDWGADLIIGAHPHVVQPIKTENRIQSDGTQKKVLITYSLGNFISNQTKLNTDGGLMFEIDLVRNQTDRKVYIGEHHYIPVWRYIERSNGKNTYRILPISAMEGANILSLPAKDKAAMYKYATTTRNHLKKFESSERKISPSEINYINGAFLSDDDFLYQILLGKFLSEPLFMPLENPVITEENGLKEYKSPIIQGRKEASKVLDKLKKAGFTTAKLIKID